MSSSSSFFTDLSECLFTGSCSSLLFPSLAGFDRLLQSSVEYNVHDYNAGFLLPLLLTFLLFLIILCVFFLSRDSSSRSSGPSLLLLQQNAEFQTKIAALMKQIESHTIDVERMKLEERNAKEKYESARKEADKLEKSMEKERELAAAAAVKAQEEREKERTKLEKGIGSERATIGRLEKELNKAREELSSAVVGMAEAQREAQQEKEKNKIRENEMKAETEKWEKRLEKANEAEKKALIEAERIKAEWSKCEIMWKNKEEENNKKLANEKGQMKAELQTEIERLQTALKAASGECALASQRASDFEAQIKEAESFSLKLHQSTQTMAAALKAKDISGSIKSESISESSSVVVLSDDSEFPSLALSARWAKLISQHAQVSDELERLNRSLDMFVQQNQELETELADRATGADGKSSKEERDKTPLKEGRSGSISSARAVFDSTPVLNRKASIEYGSGTPIAPGSSGRPRGSSVESHAWKPNAVEGPFQTADRNKLLGFIHDLTAHNLRLVRECKETKWKLAEINEKMEKEKTNKESESAPAVAPVVAGMTEEEKARMAELQRQLKAIEGEKSRLEEQMKKQSQSEIAAKAKISEMQKELNKLKDEVGAAAQLKSEISQLQTECNQLRAENDRLNAVSISDLLQPALEGSRSINSEIHSLCSELAALRAIAETSKSAAAPVSEDKKSSSRRKGEQMKDFIRSETQPKKLDLQSEESTIAALNGKIRALDAELKESQARAETQEKLVQLEKDSRSEMETRLNEELKRAKDSLVAEEIKKNEIMKSLSDREAKLNQNMEEIHKKLRLTEEKLEKLSQEHSQLRSTADEAENRAAMANKEKELIKLNGEKLQAEIKRISELLEQTKKSLLVKENEVRELELKRSELLQSVKRLESDLDERSKTISESIANQKAMRMEIEKFSEMVKVLETALETEKNKAKTNSESATKRINALELEVGSLKLHQKQTERSSSSAVESNRETAMQALQDLKRAHDSLKDESEAREKAQNELERVNSLLNARDEELETLRDQVKSLESKCEELLLNAPSGTNSNASQLALEQQINDEKANAEKLKQQINIYIQQETILQQQIVQQRTEIRELQVKIKEATPAAGSGSTDLDKLRGLLKQREAEINALRQTQDGLLEEIADVKEIAGAQETTNVKLKDELSNLKQQLSATQTD